MSTDAVKTCSKCGETKPLADFVKNERKCKPCATDYKRKWREQNKSRIAENRIANSDRIAAQKRLYRLENKEKFAEYSRRYRMENLEKIKQRERMRLSEHGPEIRAKKREWHLKNSEKISDRRKKYRETNKEKINDRARKYYAQNRCDINARRRSKYAKNAQKIAEQRKQYRSGLPDAYIARELTKDSPLTRADIPPELLEAKRLQLKLKRLAREAMK